MLTLSSIEFTIKKFSRESNLSWALGSAVEVLDNTIERVNNLIQKVKSLQSEWLDKIKENADALSSILSNVFNIATLYQEPMNTLFQNIQDFSKGLFDSLSSVIEKGNNEIEEIKDKVDKSSYPTVNKILNEVITQYKNYVQLMKDSIDLFHENGLTFINNINNALEGLTDFSVDVLYDILDEVEKAKNIYDGFADNLFNAVENGLNNFCDSMYAKVQELLGGALEIVEFIGNAMETNPIMKLVVAADQRKRMIELTYLFRKKINALVDAIFVKIRETYENQLSSAEQSSLRDELIGKMAEKLRDFNEKTNKMLTNIRSKIDSILQFEMYLQNLDLLDSIETNIMKITREKFNTVFNEPLEQYKKYFSKDIISTLRETIDNKTQPIITYIQNEATEAFDYMTELFLDYKAQFYYELNGLSEKVISFCRENLQYTYNYFNSLLINVETIMKNIMVSNYNYGKEYIDDVYAIYQRRKQQGWYSYGRTVIYEQTCIEYTTGTLGLVTCLGENLTDILKTEYITIANNVKSFLRSYLSFDFLDKYTELTYIKQYIEYIYSLDERIDEIFNEDKFEMDFSMTLGEMIVRLTDYCTLQNEEFLNYKARKIDHLPVEPDYGDFYYKEEKDNDWHSPSYFGHTDNSGKRSNTNYIGKGIATNYFSENITAIITNFTDYMEPNLKNFQNITNTIYNSVVAKLREKFTDFSNLKTLLDEYETKSLEIISDALEDKLIVNTYNNITENIENKIHTYLSFISDKVDTLNTDFFEKYLKVNISEYLDQPKEIIFKLEQMLLNQLTKGETIVNDIESLLSNHFSLIIEESYLLINDILSSTMDSIYNFLPEFPFDEFLSSRTEYINSKVNIVRSAMQSSKEMFMDIIKQSEILQVDQSDFFKIKTQIDTYKDQIVNQLETYINSIKEEIQSKAESLKGKVFDRYNFQVVKLRGAVKYFNEIKTLTKNILHKDNWKSFNYNDLYELFDYMSNYKLSHFVKEVQIYFKELNEKTMEEITPFLEIVNSNIRYVFEETVNPQLITKQLNEYTNLLYRITEDFERNAFEFVDSLKNKVGNFFQKELDDIFAKAEFQVENITYYVDQQSLDNIYTTFEKKLKDMFSNVKTSLESLEINENVLYESIEQYHKEVDKGFDKIKEGINDFSTSLPEFTLLNITFSFQDIANIALNTSYLDAFKNDISFNASSIIRNNFPTIRPKLITMVNDIETNITTYLHNKYQSFKDVLLANSKSPSNNTINITAFTENFANNMLDAIETFNFNNTKFFDLDSITSLLQSNYPYAFSVFVFNIDKEYLKQQLEESIKVFKSVCENRLMSEITEFQEVLKEKLLTKYNEVMKEFITKYGATYAKRIQNKLVDNNVVKIINTANDKLESLFDYVEYIFEDTKDFGVTSKLLFEQLLPQFAEELQEEVTDKIESFLTSSLSKIESELSEAITNNFKEIIQTHEILQKAFTPQVLEVINEMFSTKLIDTFKSKFTSIFNLDCFDNLKEQLTQQFKLNINKLKDNLISKGNAIIAILAEINKIEIPTYLNALMEYFNDYKLVIVNQVDSFVFSLTEKPLEYFSTFVNDILAPLLNKINEYYDGLQDKILAMVSEKVDQFENFLQIVQDNMPTKIIVDFAQNVHNKIDQVLEGIRTFVIGKMNEFEAAILNKINEMLSLRQIQQTETSPTAIAIRNTGLSDSLNIQQLLDSVSSIKKILDNFADQIINLKNVTKMFGSFHNFQSIIQNGIKQIKNPLNSIVSKLQTFLTPTKLTEFKDRIESEIEEIIGVATYHYDKVKEIIECNIDKIKTYPRELFEDVKEEAKDILNNLMDTALTKLLNLVEPFNISDKKDILQHPKYEIVIMVLFIPFHFKLAFNYGFEYGIEFGTKDLAIYVDAFGEAYASVDATAGVGFGILEFGAGITGDLGRGRVAIRPIFSLKSFSVDLDAHIRIKAFSFGVVVTMTYPTIELKKVKIKICRWLKITILIPIIVPKTKRYGGVAYEGIMYEKHFLMDY